MSKSDQGQDRGGRVVDYIAPDEALQAILAFLRRQYPIIALVLAAALAIGAGYLLVMRSTYTAQATLIIDTRKIQPSQPDSALFSDVPIDTPEVESQIELIKSDTIARKIIHDLNLADDPEFSRYGGGLIGNLLYYLYSIIDFGDPTAPAEVEGRAMREFAKNLSAQRVGVTYVIEVAYRSATPERAAQIANAVADAYIGDQLAAKSQATRRAGDWLSDRIQELRRQAISADKSIADFKSANNIVDSGGRSTSEQQVEELNSQVLSAQTATSEAKARLDRIDQIIKSDIRGATVTDTLKSEVVSKLRSQYLELSNQEADFSLRYGKNHVAAVNLRNQMREINRSIDAELGRLAQTYRSDYEIARQRQDKVEQSLKDAVARSQLGSQANVQLKELESNAQTYRTLYESFLQRYTEAIQQQSFPITEARVVAAATPPLKRSSPKTILVLGIALGGGLMLGLGLAILRDLSDRVIRTSEMAEALLGADCIATLPMLSAADRRATRSDARAPRGAVGRADEVFRAVLSNPFSRYAEGVRSLKVAIDLQSPTRGGRVVGVSSALPNEGKSTVTASLALLSAQAGGKTILIDGDLRNPSLTKWMAPKAAAGLLEAVSGAAELDAVIQKDPTTGLHFLPTVVRSPIANSSEILASENILRLIEELAGRYDYVLVDLSPLAPVIDVRSTGHFIQTYVLVVEWGKTNIDVLNRALAGARNMRENLLGVVLNKTDTKVLKRYEGYGESYYQHANYEHAAKVA